MDKAKRARRPRSALGSHRVLLALVLAVTALDIVVSVWAVLAVQREMSASAHSVVQSRMDQIYDKLSSINQSLKRVLVEAYQETEIVGALDADPLTRIQNRAKLMTRCNYITADAGPEYMLFYYFPNSQDYLVPHHSSAIPIAQRQAVEQALSAYIGRLVAVDSTAGQWEALEAGGSWYAVKVYRYYGVWIGSCVPAQALIAPLRTLYPDQEAVPLFLTADGTVAAGGEALEALGLSPEDAAGDAELIWHGGQRWMAVESDSAYLGFRVRLLLPEFGQFERVVVLQAAAMVVVGLVLCLVVLSMAYTQRRILRPLRAFTDGLKNYDPDDPLLPKMSGEIAELAAANESFYNLTREIQRLRIDAYERELEMQKTQMDYMQLQIKPHFFLNSLNLIHTMAQQGDTEGVSLLSNTTAKYLRYIFQSDIARMPLARELEHVRDFLSIMELRYPERFSCEIVAEPEAECQQLPPLILQTFVENAIKYGMSPNRRLEIVISALCEEIAAPGGGPETACLTLFITDNGPGFPPELLEAWAAGRQLEHHGGNHIGIANAAKRLQLAYGDKARLRLYNSPMGGAVVELHIPLEEEPV